MLSYNLLVGVCLAYVILLFLIAYLAERRAARGHVGFLRSPLVYTLSLSVYCTAWTFYGAVGSAARNGLEFVAIYLGPTLVFVGWWWLLRKLVRIGRTQRITSIADLISSRYGKSPSLAAVVTLLAVVGSTPYIALQLQSLTLSFSAFGGNTSGVSENVTALGVAIGLAVFTIVFGTRSIDANERHHGVVTAIAVEAIVKLVAVLAVGIFVVWGVSGGPSQVFSNVPEGLLEKSQIFSGRWVTLIFLSAIAIVCLPRMFQVVVVENAEERHLATASWAFPLYLFLMSLFVLPIAIAGINNLPDGANPDLFVLTVPLAFDQDALAMLAFLGGFSSATSMVIVAAIALSTMMSNHIVLPLWLRFNATRNPASDDVRTLLLGARRISIAAVLVLGYAYYRFTGGASALASIGLIAFLGVAQVLPALLGGLFWEGATRKGALAGLLVGFGFWAYTLFIPSFEGVFFSQEMLDNGLFGLHFLRPQALLGLQIEDPLTHAMVWSVGMNSIVFILVSMMTNASVIEIVQGRQFINVFDQSGGGAQIRRKARSEELLVLAQRILGRDEGMTLFREMALAQGIETGMPEPTDRLIQTLERELAGSVGAATAHAMIGQLATGEAITVEELMAVADETAEIMEYSTRLEVQSEELAKTAEQLRAANRKLMDLGEQRDAFLSQVSHELRTPMTSIRSFAEILRDSDMEDSKRNRFASVIHDESLRLTRLLDEILDLSFLESGKVQLNTTDFALRSVLDRALVATETLVQEKRGVIVRSGQDEDVGVHSDFDRLAQVFINLISNALKHGKPENCIITIVCRDDGDDVLIEIQDNGIGVAEPDRDVIFEKFSKLSGQMASGSAGLGLPISQEIMRNLGGDLRYVHSDTGAIFQVRLPKVSKSAIGF